MADDTSPMYERGAATMQAIGSAAPGPGRNRFPNLPPEQADDVQRRSPGKRKRQLWSSLARRKPKPRLTAL